MRKLAWKEEYGIGHYQTDQEHKELISLANEVISLSVSGKTIDKLKSALQALGEYTKYHFRNEENYMQRIGYPGLADHKKSHLQLIEQLNSIITQNKTIDDLVTALKRLMVVWVIEHIIHEDTKITPEKTDTNQESDT